MPVSIGFLDWEWFLAVRKSDYKCKSSDVMSFFDNMVVKTIFIRIKMQVE